eukprot:COSAG01_NODE_2105_length_8423_cov_6.483409_1_plen_218_part_00
MRPRSAHVRPGGNGAVVGRRSAQQRRARGGGSRLAARGSLGQQRRQTAPGRVHSHQQQLSPLHPPQQQQQQQRQRQRRGDDNKNNNAGPAALYRPGSSHSQQLTDLYRGVNVSAETASAEGGLVDAAALVEALDTPNNEHTEMQLKAMRRCMMLCDPQPSVELASANCRALAGAGALPVLVRPLIDWVAARQRLGRCDVYEALMMRRARHLLATAPQ